ncbi:MAG: hypothetical protein SNJ52_02445, partial [Verrucomicrobiia bacterium]
ILALLPIGVTSVQDSVEEIAALSTMQKLIADLQSEPTATASSRFGIAFPDQDESYKETTLLLNEGGEAEGEIALARYRFVVTVWRRDTDGNRHVHLRAEWPAGGTAGGSLNSVETVAAIR